MYSKFRSLGFPTDPVGRAKVLEVKYLHFLNGDAGELNQGIIFDNIAGSQSPNIHGNQLPHLLLNPILARTAEPWSYNCDIGSPTLGQALEHTNLQPLPRVEQVVEGDFPQDTSIESVDCQTLESEIHPGTPYHPPNDTLICEDWDFDQAFEFRSWPTRLDGVRHFNQDSVQSNVEALQHGLPDKLGFEMELNLDTAQHWTRCLPYKNPDHDSKIFGPQCNGECRPESALCSLFCCQINHPTPARSGHSVEKIRSWFRSKTSESYRAKRTYPDSQYTTRTGDSGYDSGFTSRTIFAEVSDTNPTSVEEFNGLHRVACCVMHEPRGKAQWKDVPTCKYCRYSSIHNLGWSARYLKAEDFSSELKLNQVYDLGALDAAGNTALHYAAAGGAGFKHLKALIDTGVDPYAANTAGELFIYCLRPLQPFTLEPNSDCFDGDDLIHLLKLLRPELAFDWRDNDGQTIMHALALKISEPELKAKVFK